MKKRNILMVAAFAFCVATPWVDAAELLVDLDADVGVEADGEGKVSSWANGVKASPAKFFKINDEGMRAKKKGSGKPFLKKNLAELNGNSSLAFRNDELVNSEEDYFDGLTTGKGHTWLMVMKPYETDSEKTEFGQKPLKDVNSFIGNLKNGAKYCGFWGCLDDDLTVWIGCRNDKTFGRFDANNPKVTGPKLEKDKFYIIASRMQPGQEKAKLELFINEAKSVAAADFPVNTEANPSKLAVGTERDAIEHPGAESFDGEIAKLLIYEGALSNEELKKQMEQLKKRYFGKK